LHFDLVTKLLSNDDVPRKQNTPLKKKAARGQFTTLETHRSDDLGTTLSTDKRQEYEAS